MIANRRSIDVIAILAASVMTWSGAAAFDDTKYPDWSGQWGRTRGVGVQWDETKPPGLKQEAPLTAEYQAKLEASIADQADGGQGGGFRVTCISIGMPRLMTVMRPMTLFVMRADPSDVVDYNQ